MVALDIAVCWSSHANLFAFLGLVESNSVTGVAAAVVAVVVVVAVGDVDDDDDDDVWKEDNNMNLGMSLAIRSSFGQYIGLVLVGVVVVVVWSLVVR